jgi:MFS family permease
VAGITISAFGEAFCFFANAMSYLAVIYALLKVRVAVKPKIQQHTSIVQSLKGGFEATFNHPSIKWIILFLGFMSLVGLPFNTVFPALAAAQKNGDSHTLGWVTSATGFGALLGALYLVRRSSSPLLGRRVVKAALQFSVALILISFGWRLEILLLLLVVAGMGMMILMAGCNTIVQTVIPDHLRSRVMSFFNFALLGVSPFGNLLFGASTQEWGIQVTFLTHGIICVIGSLYFFKMSETINKTVSQHFRQQGHHVEL